jgi:predicted ATPase
LFNVASLVDAVGASDSCAGTSLHDQSHGESFISLLQNRAVWFIELSIAIAGAFNG